VVLACSALRPAYRRVLEGGMPQQAAFQLPQQQPAAVTGPEEQQHTAIAYVSP
jgi:gluconate kinase